MTKKYVNGILVDLTAENIAAEEAKEKAFRDKSPERKLNKIKEIRLQKLNETD